MTIPKFKKGDKVLLEGRGAYGLPYTVTGFVASGTIIFVLITDCKGVMTSAQSESNLTLAPSDTVKDEVKKTTLVSDINIGDRVIVNGISGTATVMGVTLSYRIKNDVTGGEQYRHAENLKLMPKKPKVFCFAKVLAMMNPCDRLFPSDIARLMTMDKKTKAEIVAMYGGTVAVSDDAFVAVE